MKLLALILLAASPFAMPREAHSPVSQAGAASEGTGAQSSAPEAARQAPAQDSQVPGQEPAAPLIDQPEADEGAPIGSAAPASQATASHGRTSHKPRRRRRKPGRTYAPIGVPLTQQVATGQFGLSLRLARDQFDGLQDSRKKLTSADAFARGYAIAPTERTDLRYELEAMFGYDKRWDLYLMIPYTAREMDQDLSIGGQTQVESSGLGDIQLGGIFRSYDRGPTRVSYMAGISLPTGDVDASDNYGGAPDTTLPYSMQLGSGTFDLLPGVLIESRFDDIRVGARAAGRIHLQSANDEGWFRSNSMRLDLWAGKRLAKNLDGSLRAQADWWGDLHGADPDLIPLRNPLEDSLRQGGSRVMLFGGLSKDLDRHGNQRIAIEIGIPVDEWLDGPGLSQEWSAVIGWTLKF